MILLKLILISKNNSLKQILYYKYMIIVNININYLQILML